MIELRQFITEEQMKENFPALTEILEIDLDENSIGKFFFALICLLCVLSVGATGTFSLAIGLPIYLITGKKKKKKIEDFMKKNYKFNV